MTSPQAVSPLIHRHAPGLVYVHASAFGSECCAKAY